MRKTIALSQLVPGNRAVVLDIQCRPELRLRLEALGLIPGAEVACLGRSPAGTPAAYEICGAVIALRSRDTREIWVEVET